MKNSSREAFLKRAQELVPVLQERASKTAKLRQIPEETISDLEAAGLWRVLKPESYGGYLSDFGLMIDIAIELGRGCASTAWVYINIVSHNWMLPLWPKKAMDAIWGENEKALIGSTLVFPAGRLEPLQNGYKFTGRWPYASGIDASDWMMLGAMKKSDSKALQARIVVVRAKDTEQVG